MSFYPGSYDLRRARSRRGYRFLPLPDGYAHAMKDSMAWLVLWKPLRRLGYNTGFYRDMETPIWHFVYRGRRIW